MSTMCDSSMKNHRPYLDEPKKQLKLTILTLPLLEKSQIDIIINSLTFKTYFNLV